MALKLRLARAGRKGRPSHKIVVVDSRMPRDGRFIEKVGTYNPLLANDNPNRLALNEDRAKYWLEQGAKPSDRVARLMSSLGLVAKPSWNETPQKSAPKEKAKMRAEEKEEKLKAQQEAEAAAAAEAENAKKADAADEVQADQEAAAKEGEPAEELVAASDAPAEEPAEESAKEESAEEGDKKE